MYFQQSEHNPPHIHAIYGEYIAAISISDFKILEGDLPHKAISLVLEWMSLQGRVIKYVENTKFQTNSTIRIGGFLCFIKLNL